MPTVLCSLHCFDVPTLSTAGSVAREFSASLDPALDAAGCAVEVYRLQPVAHDAQLAADDTVLCRLPAWRFDLAALEELLSQLEELRAEHHTLKVQHGRTREALISLNASVEANELATLTPQRGHDNHQEVQLLRQQLAQSERKQQETKATVMALRSEFMHLINISGYGGPPQEFTLDAQELDENALPVSPYCNAYEMEKLSGSCSVDRAKRHGPQQSTGLCGRRRGASPRTYRSPTIFSATPRPGSRSQGAPQHKGYSVSTYVHQRQRQMAEGVSQGNRPSGEL